MLGIFLLVLTVGIIIYLLYDSPALNVILLFVYGPIISLNFDLLGIESARNIFRYIIVLLSIIFTYKSIFNIRLFSKYGKNNFFLAFTILLIVIIFNIVLGRISDDIVDFFIAFLTYSYLPFIITLILFTKKIKLKSVPESVILLGILTFFIIVVNEDITKIEMGNRMSIKDELGLGPIYTARIATLLIISSMLFLFNYKNKVTRFLSSISLVFGITMLLFAPQRGSIIGIFISFLVFMFYNKNKLQSRRFFGGVLAIVFILSTVNLEKFNVFNRFKQLDNYKEQERYLDYSNTYNSFVDNPLIGLGPRGYLKKYNRKYPHSLLLELTAEYGIIGLVIALTIIFTGLRMSFSIIKSRSSLLEEKNIAMWWIAMLVSVLVSGNIVRNDLFWVLSALLIVSNHKHIKQIV